jgi:hypothetical protein
LLSLSVAWHPLEIEWQASSAAGANDGLVRLWLDGSLASEQTGLDNDTRRVAEAQLGAVSVQFMRLLSVKLKTVERIEFNQEGRSKSQQDPVEFDTSSGFCFAPTRADKKGTGKGYTIGPAPATSGVTRPA